MSNTPNLPVLNELMAKVSAPAKRTPAKATAKSSAKAPAKSSAKRTPAKATAKAPAKAAKPTAVAKALKAQDAIVVSGNNAELAAAIETMATRKGVHTLSVDMSATTLKLVTDRIRRIPRVKGLSALAVRVSEASTAKLAVLIITNAGVKATPWPAKQAAAKAAPAKRTPAKAKAPAKRTPAKSSAKAAAKRNS